MKICSFSSRSFVVLPFTCRPAIPLELIMVYDSVTGIGVLGFPKRKIESKPQRNLQTGFIKIMPEHKGGSTEDRKVL